MLSRHQLYRLKNKDKIREYEKSYRELNKEKKKAYDKKHYIKNKQEIKERNHLYRILNKGQTNSRVAKRRASQKTAIPVWADLSEIKKIYKEAAELRKNGCDVHVDHIVPLTSKFVSGLHVSVNLRIISSFENVSKYNKYWPDMWDY